MDGTHYVDKRNLPQQAEPVTEPLIPRHGGYRNLKSFQVAQLVYDVTAAFCDAHIERRSRTHDQMVQAARSGVQNIAEGSQASGTSKKMEMKLTSVARASLEELRLDYEDYLRQRGLELWPPNHAVLQRFKARRCASMEDMQSWLRDELALQSKSTDSNQDTDYHGRTQTRHGPEEAEHSSAQTGHRSQNTDTQDRTQTHTDNHGLTPTRQAPTGATPPDRPPSVSVSAGPYKSVQPAQFMANGALSLLNLACYLLDRQLIAQAVAFEKDGGFTERLYGHRRTERER